MDSLMTEDIKPVSAGTVTKALRRKGHTRVVTKTGDHPKIYASSDITAEFIEGELNELGFVTERRHSLITVLGKKENL